MKNFIFVLLLTLPLTATAQQNKNSEINYYLQKSLNKKKTGKVLLLTGTTFTLIGAVVATTGDHRGAIFFSSTEMVGITVATLGVISALTSIPFYISANQYRKKSLKISPTTGLIQTNSITEPKYFPSAGLNITF